MKLDTYLDLLADCTRNTCITDAEGRALTLSIGADRAADMIRSYKKTGSGKVVLVGNGGSAALVSHMQNDLCNSVGVRAMVFTEQPLLTALANDHGYDRAYPRASALWADQNDLLIAVSSSGRSENILKSVEAFRSRGARVITFSGFDSANPLSGLGDINFFVPGTTYGFVETAHGMIMHFLTDRATLEE